MALVKFLYSVFRAWKCDNSTSSSEGGVVGRFWLDLRRVFRRCFLRRAWRVLGVGVRLNWRSFWVSCWSVGGWGGVGWRRGGPVEAASMAAAVVVVGV